MNSVLCFWAIIIKLSGTFGYTLVDVVSANGDCTGGGFDDVEFCYWIGLLGNVSALTSLETDWGLFGFMYLPKIKEIFNTTTF